MKSGSRQPLHRERQAGAAELRRLQAEIDKGRDSPVDPRSRSEIIADAARPQGRS